MPPSLPSVSTDQVAAFVALARLGSLRQAARELHITEQGLRNRLLVLEERLGAELYRKSRGPRRATPLTEEGRHFLPHALAFLDRARQLAEHFGGPDINPSFDLGQDVDLYVVRSGDDFARLVRTRDAIRIA